MTTMRQITAITAATFEVSPEELYARGKGLPRVSHARFAAMVACRDTGSSFPKIAAHFNRDHTTIIHGVRRARELAAESPAYADRLTEVRERIV